MTKKKLIILASALFLTIVATVLALTVFGGGDSVSFEGTTEKSKPVEQALTAIYNEDGSGYYAAFPPALKEKYEETYVIPGTFVPCKTMGDYLKSYMSKVNKANYGEDYTVEVEFLKEEKLSVEKLNGMASDPNLDVYTYMRFVTEENTEELWQITLKIKYSGSLDEEEKEQFVYVVKQDGKWYLHPCFVFYGF